MTAEAIRVCLLPQLERRALDVRPAKRAADDDAQILPGDLIRLQTFDTQPRHAARSVSRHDPQVAQPVAAESGRPQRAQQIVLVQLRDPRWRALARIVLTRP